MCKGFLTPGLEEKGHWWESSGESWRYICAQYFFKVLKLIDKSDFVCDFHVYIPIKILEFERLGSRLEFSWFSAARISLPSDEKNEILQNEYSSALLVSLIRK